MPVSPLVSSLKEFESLAIMNIKHFYLPEKANYFTHHSYFLYPQHLHLNVIYFSDALVLGLNSKDHLTDTTEQITRSTSDPQTADTRA